MKLPPKTKPKTKKLQDSLFLINRLKTVFYFLLLKTGSLIFQILQKEFSTFLYTSWHQDEILVSSIVWPEALGQMREYISLYPEHSVRC